MHLHVQPQTHASITVTGRRSCITAIPATDVGVITCKRSNEKLIKSCKCISVGCLHLKSFFSHAHCMLLYTPSTSQTLTQILFKTATLTIHRSERLQVLYVHERELCYRHRQRLRQQPHSHIHPQRTQPPHHTNTLPPQHTLYSNCSHLRNTYTCLLTYTLTHMLWFTRKYSHSNTPTSQTVGY